MSSVPHTSPQTHEWSNWSGSVSCRPQTLAAPRDEAELAELVAQASTRNLRIRAVGSGHSFVPLCAVDEILVSLHNLKGVVDADPLARQATVRSGSVIADLGDALHTAGLAMENMGDIDRQSIAGAVSTGTHGTGRNLGSISTQVIGLHLVTASGAIVECSPERDLATFKAAQLSLGSLGIIVRVTLRLQPSYLLHERTWALPVERCMRDWDHLAAENRHVEFFWSPREDACALKALNPSNRAEPATLTPPPDVSGRLNRYIGPERIDYSYRIFPSERTQRFNETEFAVPAENGPDCFLQIRALMQSTYPDVIWPIEYRTLAADDIYLSPAYARDSVTISVHEAYDKPFRPFFDDVETIFRAHGGRPHWGKVHRHDAGTLPDLYPQWDQFQHVRRRMDPEGRYMNDYLKGLFGA